MPEEKQDFDPRFKNVVKFWQDFLFPPAERGFVSPLLPPEPKKRFPWSKAKTAPPGGARASTILPQTREERSADLIQRLFTVVDKGELRIEGALPKANSAVPLAYYLSRGGNLVFDLRTLNAVERDKFWGFLTGSAQPLLKADASPAWIEFPDTGGSPREEKVSRVARFFTPLLRFLGIREEKGFKLDFSAENPNQAAGVPKEPIQGQIKLSYARDSGALVLNIGDLGFSEERGFPSDEVKPNFKKNSLVVKVDSRCLQRLGAGSIDRDRLASAPYHSAVALAETETASEQQKKRVKEIKGHQPEDRPVQQAMVLPHARPADPRVQLQFYSARLDLLAPDAFEAFIRTRVNAVKQVLKDPNDPSKGYKLILPASKAGEAEFVLYEVPASRTIIFPEAPNLKRSNDGQPDEYVRWVAEFLAEQVGSNGGDGSGPDAPLKYDVVGGTPQERAMVSQLLNRAETPVFQLFTESAATSGAASPSSVWEERIKEKNLVFGKSSPSILKVKGEKVKAYVENAKRFVDGSRNQLNLATLRADRIRPASMPEQIIRQAARPIDTLYFKDGGAPILKRANSYLMAAGLWIDGAIPEDRDVERREKIKQKLNNWYLDFETRFPDQSSLKAGKKALDRFVNGLALILHNGVYDEVKGQDIPPVKTIFKELTLAEALYGWEQSRPKVVTVSEVEGPELKKPQEKDFNVMEMLKIFSGNEKERPKWFKALTPPMQTVWQNALQEWLYEKREVFFQKLIDEARKTSVLSNAEAIKGAYRPLFELTDEGNYALDNFVNWHQELGNLSIARDAMDAFFDGDGDEDSKAKFVEWLHYCSTGVDKPKVSTSTEDSESESSASSSTRASSVSEDSDASSSELESDVEDSEGYEFSGAISDSESSESSGATDLAVLARDWFNAMGYVLKNTDWNLNAMLQSAVVPKAVLRVQATDTPATHTLTKAQYEEFCKIYNQREQDRPQWFNALPQFAQHHLRQKFLEPNGSIMSYESAQTHIHGVPSLLRSVPGTANAMEHTLVQIIPGVDDSTVQTLYSAKRSAAVGTLEIKDKQDAQTVAQQNLEQVLFPKGLDEQSPFIQKAEAAWGIQPHERETVIFPIVVTSVMSPTSYHNLPGGISKKWHLIRKDNDRLLIDAKDHAVAKLNRDAETISGYGRDVSVLSVGPQPKKSRICLMTANHTINAFRQARIALGGFIGKSESSKESWNRAQNLLVSLRSIVLMMYQRGRQEDLLLLNTHLSELDRVLQTCLSNKKPLNKDQYLELREAIERFKNTEGVVAALQAAQPGDDPAQQKAIADRFVTTLDASLDYLYTNFVCEERGLDRNRPLWKACSELTFEELLGDAYFGCKSGKDRTGVVEIHLDAMWQFREFTGHFPRYDDSDTDRKLFVSLFAQGFLSGHQQLLASLNAPGANGLKSLGGILVSDLKGEIIRLDRVQQFKAFLSMNKDWDWTPDVQKQFLKGIADGKTVSDIFRESEFLTAMNSMGSGAAPDSKRLSAWELRLKTFEKSLVDIFKRNKVYSGINRPKCHLEDSEFKAEVQKELKNANTSGVQQIICPAVRELIVGSRSPKLNAELIDVMNSLLFSVHPPEGGRDSTVKAYETSQKQLILAVLTEMQLELPKGKTADQVAESILEWNRVMADKIATGTAEPWENATLVKVWQFAEQHPNYVLMADNERLSYILHYRSVAEFVEDHGVRPKRFFGPAEEIEQPERQVRGLIPIRGLIPMEERYVELLQQQEAKEVAARAEAVAKEGRKGRGSVDSDDEEPLVFRSKPRAAPPFLP